MFDVSMLCLTCIPYKWLYFFIWHLLCLGIRFVLFIAQMYNHNYKPQEDEDQVLFTKFPGGSDSKESACNAGGLDSILGPGKSPTQEGDFLPEKEMATHSCILVWRFHVKEPGSYSPCGCKESDMTN